MNEAETGGEGGKSVFPNVGIHQPYGQLEVLAFFRERFSGQLNRRTVIGGLRGQFSNRLEERRYPRGGLP